jgi:hypothetical protein
MFPNSSGVLFFGAEGEKPIAWNAIQKLAMVETSIAEEQSKIFATMRDSTMVSFNCTINKNGIKNIMELTRRFKLAKGPYRKRMIKRAKKMQTNYISTYTFRKEGDEYVDERGAFRLVLQ